VTAVWVLSCSDGSGKKRVPVPQPDAAAGMGGEPTAQEAGMAGASPASSAGAGAGGVSEAGAAGATSLAEGGAGGEGPSACSPATCPMGGCVLGECLPTVTIAQDVNLSQVAISNGRTCAEAIAYSVTNLSFDEATLSATPAAGCLELGDEVLLINLQGTAAAHGNVGNWELLRVAQVNAQTVRFAAQKTRFYGTGTANDTGIGLSATTQRVALIRVPRFGKLVVNAGKTVTADAWNGTRGGVLALRAGELDLAGTLDAAALGYRAGRWSEDDISCTRSTQTESGESIAGLGSLTTAANFGASGGISGASSSFNTNTPIVSSPGHAQAGQLGFNAAPRTLGAPGATYGVPDATKLTLGSGPGGGLKCLPTTPQTPPILVQSVSVQAGGIALLLVDDLEIAATGSVSAAPPDAGRDISFSGGYIYARGSKLAIGTGRVSALGSKGRGINGPTVNDSNLAGPGYVVLEGTTVTGTSTPPAHLLVP
jgi:hypothetical protein